MSALHIKTCLFDEEKEVIRHIRDRVFAVEQGIDPKLDWDGKDGQAVHLLAFFQQLPVAVARMREVSSGDSVKLERLAVLSDYRRQGIGSELVYTAIAYGKEQGYQHIVLNAQIQTVDFYRKIGFESIGSPFQEAGIAHLKMQIAL